MANASLVFTVTDHEPRATLIFFDLVSVNVDKRNLITFLLLDMPKAFDRLPPERRLPKIKSYELVESLYSWSTSYLFELSQAVSVNRKLSQ